jgi:hypothetical protein
MDYANSLYHLIRDRAGSKMLRQAESINMYEQVSDYLDDYLDDSHIDATIQLYKDFEIKYPSVTESHMGAIWLDEIQNMDEYELQTLPWIYVHMLETLVSHDPLAVSLLSQKLASSPAAAWRIPLTDVAAEDSFTHIYEEWLAANPWIQSFTELATAENFQVEDDIDM